MNARAEMPDWTLMVWMLDAYAEKCTGQQRRDEAIEQAAALRAWLAAQPVAPEGGDKDDGGDAKSEFNAPAYQVRLLLANGRAYSDWETVSHKLWEHLDNPQSNERRIIETPPASGEVVSVPGLEKWLGTWADTIPAQAYRELCAIQRLSAPAQPAPAAREAVAWQYRIRLRDQWERWCNIPREEWEETHTSAHENIQYRRLFDETPTAGAVVVDEAAVNRLADFIEDRPAYICLPDDERKRIAREYLTAAIGGGK